MTGLAVVLRAGVWVGEDMLLHGEACRWDGRDEESESGSKLPVCRLYVRNARAVQNCGRECRLDLLARL
jgi:hypothetical protein